MPKLIKKTKKLFRSPKLFFRDSIFFGGRNLSNNERKKIDPLATDTEGNIKKKGSNNTFKFSNLTENFSELHNQEHILFKLLDKAGINYIIITTAWKHILRIAIQDSFINNVLDLIKESDEFSKKVYIAKGSNRYELVKIYFHDDDFVYKNRVIQLDPWYMTPNGVMTSNRNSSIQFVPKAHVNKTVHSCVPIRLGRDVTDVDNLKSLLGIKSFMFEEYPDPIDIVFTWVSDTDPHWLEKKSFYSGEKYSNINTRFVEYEQLRYSLRSVEAYAKFIRNIYIITDNQIPYWLDVTHDKIKIINHHDICDDLSSLPVFNSVAIESWVHKIEGLSENFIYANDDYFFGSPVNKSHFIHSNGVAKLFLEPIPNAYGETFEDSEPTVQLSLFTAQCFYEKYNSWPSFWPLHAPMIKNIEVIKEMNVVFETLMNKTSRSRFRENNTISPLYLMSSYYSYEKGRSVVASIKYEYISTDATNLESRLVNLLAKIKAGQCDVFCLNDHRTVSEQQIEKVVQFMKTAFPIAASWELDKNEFI